MDETILAYMRADSGLSIVADAFDRVVTNRRGVALLSGVIDGQRVALKLVLPQAPPFGTYDPGQSINREVTFLRAYGASIGADHLIEAGRAEGGPWMMMRWIDGVGADRAFRPTMTPSQVTALCARIARAVGALHAIGFVHGDLQPGHLLVRDASVRMVDFALTHRPGTFDYRGAMIHFLAPELAGPMLRGEPMPIDEICEVYSVGAVLFYGITGETPTDYGDATTLEDRLDRIACDGFGRDRMLCNRFEGSLADAICRCLAFDRDERFTSIHAFAELLERA